MLKRITETLFLLTVFSLPIVNPPAPFGAGLRTQYTEILFLLGGSAFAAAVVAGAIRIRNGGFYIPVAAYLAAAVFSSIFSVSPRTSAVKLLGVAYLAGLAILAFNVLRDADALRRTVLVWLAATALVTAYACFVLAAFYVSPESAAVKLGLSHYGTFPPGNYPRIQSLFANPNMFCNYLSVSWMLLLGAYSSGWLRKPIAAALGAMIAVSAAFTLSPGIGAFILCTGAWLWLRRTEDGWFPKAALVAGLTVAAAFLAVTAVKFEKDLTVSSDPSARVLTWSSAARTMAEDPLTGKGLGTYAADASYGHQRLRDAHNTFLNVGAETGVAGLAALIFFCWWFLSAAYRGSIREGSKGAMALAMGTAFFGAFVYQGLAGSFEDARHLWVLAGMIGAAGAGVSGEATDD